MRRRLSPAALLLLLALAGVLVFAGFRAVQAFSAYQRLAGPGAAGGVRVRDFVPLDAIARRNGVPVSVLLDALRGAGFTLEPQRVLPELPPGLPGPRGGRGGSGGGGGPDAPSGDATAAADGLLPPEQQSLRQIARHSNRAPQEAVRVVRDAIAAYGPRERPSPRDPPAPGGPGRSPGPPGPPQPPEAPGDRP